MRKVIGGLNPFQFDEITNVLGDWYYDVSTQEITGLFDVILDDSTILKVTDTYITLRCRNRDYTMSLDSFCFIVIE